MDFKTVGIFILLLIVAFYLTPYVRDFLMPHARECEIYYDMLEEEDYTQGYGDRVKAVTKKCF